MKEKISPYLPGIVLFVAALVLGLATYKDYGMAWDEPLQRDPAVIAWNYAVHGDQTLFKTSTDNHGTGFELLLLLVEKNLHLTDTRDIFLMRHIFSHIFFLLGAFAGYVLVYRLFRDKWIASLGFIMFVFSPRIYAHSFFNSKDVPFLSMVLVTLAFSQIAFDKKKPLWFALLGIACGYATGIRIMGIMYALLIILMLLIDLLLNIKKKEKPAKPLINVACFMAGFTVFVYLAWPYLWKEPVAKFVESFDALAHYNFNGNILFQGDTMAAPNLPWYYLPVWFFITTPLLWLLSGFAGLGWVLFEFVRKPVASLENSNERNFLFYVLCFVLPVISVLALHSVVYDDWRHVYFVYPAFVLLGLFFINKFYNTKFKKIALAICGLQCVEMAVFFVQNHPNEQVYFNQLESHDDENLRKNYELDYWACSFKQGLEAILEHDNSPTIKLCGTYLFPIDNNIKMLPAEERKRFVLVENAENADYFFTNFRLHRGDYPSNNIDFEIKVGNSTIMRVYRMGNAKPNTVIPNNSGAHP